MYDYKTLGGNFDCSIQTGKSVRYTPEQNGAAEHSMVIEARVLLVSPKVALAGSV